MHSPFIHHRAHCGSLPHRTKKLAISLGVLALLAAPALAQSSEALRTPEQGPRRSPDDVSYLRKRGDEPGEGLLGTGLFTLLVPSWFDWKADIEEATGFDFGLSYTGLYQKATDSVVGPDSAGSGDFDIFGEWTLVGSEERGTQGMLGWSLEDRHKYTDISPSQLGDTIGSMWPTTRAFNTHPFALIQIYWDQHLADDKLEFRIGKYDHNNIWDTYTFRSEVFYFENLMFSGNVSFGPPTSLGGFVSWRPTDATYGMIGIADANGERDSLDFSSFFDERDYYYFAEVGVSPRMSAYEMSFYHATFWHVDAREQAGTSSGSGVTLTMQHSLNDFIPWLRYAWSDADANTVNAQQNINAGFGLMRPFGRDDDVVAFGIGGGQQVDGLRWQVSTEAFYRIQLTSYIQLTPSIQGIFNPVNNPDKDVLGVYGIRFSYTL